LAIWADRETWKKSENRWKSKRKKTKLKSEMDPETCNIRGSVFVAWHIWGEKIGKLFATRNWTEGEVSERKKEVGGMVAGFERVVKEGGEQGLKV